MRRACVGSDVVNRRTEARDGSQQVVWLDTGTPVACCDRCFKQGFEGGLKSPLEIGGRASYALSRARAPSNLNQAEHHKKFSYQEEIREIFKRHRVAFDERYD